MKTKSMLLGTMTGLLLVACASSIQPLDPDTPKIVHAYGEGWQVVVTSKDNVTLTLKSFGAYKPVVTDFKVSKEGADISMNLANGMYQYHLVVEKSPCVDHDNQAQAFSAQLIRGGHEDHPRVGCAVLNLQGQ